MNAPEHYLPSREDFENGRIDPERFDHAAHIYVGWLYTGAWPLREAIGRFTAALRRLTVQFGAPGKYHETITWCFLLASTTAREHFVLPDRSVGKAA